MRSSSLALTAFWLGSVCLPAGAAPIKRAHRPWLMIGHTKSSEPSKGLQTREAEPKPITTRIEKEPAPVALRAAEEESRGSQVAKQALRYKGTRYKFGGTSKRGIDCSGLVARVFEDLKLKKIPRASASLYKTGTPVTLSELRPGDLVFFKNTYRRGISHVGVYAGHNKFVHASNHRTGVTVTALSDPYYQLHYAGARRLY